MRFTGDNTKKLIKEQGRNIVIPYGYTDISSSSFYYCDNVKSITIPESVSNIEMRAFCYCKNLSKIIIPDSVTAIERDAFKGCERLIVCCPPDSYAYKYCAENNIKTKKSRKIIKIEPQLKLDAQDIFEIDIPQMPVIGNGRKSLADKIDAYGKKIRILINSIKDMSIYGGLAEIEKTMRNIQARLKDETNAINKTDQLNELLDYHMPTFLKILNNYKNIEVYNLKDDNAVKTKKQVAEMLPVVKKAFEKELNNMFNEINIDISTDVEMFKSMMSLDGFSEKNDKNGKNN